MTIAKEADVAAHSPIMPRLALFIAGLVAFVGMVIVALVSMQSPDLAGVFGGAVETFVAAVIAYVSIRSAGWVFVGRW
jgi:hypothetical protein